MRPRLTPARALGVCALVGIAALGYIDIARMHASPPTAKSTRPETSGPTTTAASPHGWPGPGDTGVPPGIVLAPRSGIIDLNRNGQVLDSVSLTGCIDVTAANVTVKNTRIRGFLGCFAGIRTDGGHSLLVEDTEIDGLGKDGEAFGITQVTGSYTCLRCNVHGVGVAYGANGTGTVSVQDSWGWGLVASATSHNQDFLSNGTTSGVTLRHNRFDDPLAQTATISLFGDFAPIQNVTVDHNLLSGGDFCVYAGHDPDKPYGTQDANVKFTNNHFMRTPEPGALYANCALYGPVTSFDGSSPGNVWSGNVWDDTGAPVPPDG